MNFTVITLALYIGIVGVIMLTRSRDRAMVELIGVISLVVCALNVLLEVTRNFK